MKKLLLFGLIFLILLTPVMSAEEEGEIDENLEQYSDVVIVADYYEPAVITSSVLEDGQLNTIPVYVILKGVKLNPQVEDIVVKKVTASITDVRSEPAVDDPFIYLNSRRRVDWIKPRNPTLNDPGYLKLDLRPLSSEHAPKHETTSFSDLPSNKQREINEIDEIKNAETEEEKQIIRAEKTKDLLLAQKDETWVKNLPRKKRLESLEIELEITAAYELRGSSGASTTKVIIGQGETKEIFQQRATLFAEQISSERADLKVTTNDHESTRNPEPTDMKIPYEPVTQVGGVSKQFNLRTFGKKVGFNVHVDKISGPEPRAAFRVLQGLQNRRVESTVNSPIFDGSPWIIKDISPGAETNSVTIENFRTGSVRTLTRTLLQENEVITFPDIDIFQDAIREFEITINDYPNDYDEEEGQYIAEQALLKLKEIYIRAGDYDLAIDSIQRVITDYYPAETSARNKELRAEIIELKEDAKFRYDWLNDGIYKIRLAGITDVNFNELPTIQVEKDLGPSTEVKLSELLFDGVEWRLTGIEPDKIVISREVTTERERRGKLVEVISTETKRVNVGELTRLPYSLEDKTIGITKNTFFRIADDGKLVDDNGKTYQFLDIQGPHLIIKEYGALKLQAGTKTNDGSPVNGYRLHEDFEGLRSIRVVSTNPKHVAHLTIKPSEEQIKSEISETISLKIEQRAIDLTPERIDSQIEATEKLIQKIDSISKKLENIVKLWTRVCQAVGAYIFVKRLGESPEKVVARREVMAHWTDHCGSQTEDSFDDCIEKNAETITKDTDTIKKAIKSQKNILEQLRDKPEDKESILSGLNSLSDGDANKLAELNKKGLVSDTEINQLILDDAINNEIGQRGVNLYGSGTGLTQAQERIVEKAELEEKVDSLLQGSDEQDRIVRQAARNALEGDALSSEELQNLDKGLASFKVSRIYDIKGQGSPFYIDPEQGKVLLTRRTVDRVPILNRWFGGYELHAPVEVPDPEKPGETTQTQRVVALEIITGSKVAKPEVITRDGHPYMFTIPGENQFGGKYSGKGLYVKVLERYSSGDPKTIRVFDVGPDGQIGSAPDGISDDEPIELLSDEIIREDLAGYSTRIFQRAAEVSDELDTKLARNEGRITVGNDVYNVNNVARSTGPHCAEYMDIADCKLLFAVCDWVACPASRFNLGGKVQNPEPIRSGIVGSITLGAHNKRICVSGLNAAVKNIQTNLEGYNQCLQTAKNEDRSVGVCDKVRSVFLCETVWKEAQSGINLAKKGPVSGIRSGQSALSGGGEYLDVRTTLKSAGDTANFYTNEYGKELPKIYKTGDTSTLATQICERALFSKVPDTPIFEDNFEATVPSQYSAWFDSFEWSEAAGESRYQVYYHIYAGENRDVRYQIYLQKPGDTVFIPNEAGVQSGQYTIIPKGEFVDVSRDFIAQSGFDQLCIHIEGEAPNCGFGKVSTSFLDNYVEEQFLLNDAKKKFQTEAECLGGSELELSLSGARDATARAGLSAVRSTTGFTNYGGINRKCSVTDPNLDIVQAITSDSLSVSRLPRWIGVGTCGVDEDTGTPLGGCWLETESVARQVELTDKEILVDGILNANLETIGESESKLTYDDIQSKRIELLIEENRKTLEGGITLNGIRLDIQDLPPDQGNKLRILENIRKTLSSIQTELELNILPAFQGLKRETEIEFYQGKAQLGIGSTYLDIALLQLKIDGLLNSDIPVTGEERVPGSGTDTQCTLEYEPDSKLSSKKYIFSYHEEQTTGRFTWHWKFAGEPTFNLITGGSKELIYAKDGSIVEVKDKLLLQIISDLVKDPADYEAGLQIITAYANGNGVGSGSTILIENYDGEITVLDAEGKISLDQFFFRFDKIKGWQYRFEGTSEYNSVNSLNYKEGIEKKEITGNLVTGLATTSSGKITTPKSEMVQGEWEDENGNTYKYEHDVAEITVTGNSDLEKIKRVEGNSDLEKIKSEPENKKIKRVEDPVLVAIILELRKNLHDYDKGLKTIVGFSNKKIDPVAGTGDDHLKILIGGEDIPVEIAPIFTQSEKEEDYEYNFKNGEANVEIIKAICPAVPLDCKIQFNDKKGLLPDQQIILDYKEVKSSTTGAKNKFNELFDEHNKKGKFKLISGSNVIHYEEFESARREFLEEGLQLAFEITEPDITDKDLHYFVATKERKQDISDQGFPVYKEYFTSESTVDELLEFCLKGESTPRLITREIVGTRQSIIESNAETGISVNKAYRYIYPDGETRSEIGPQQAYELWKQEDYIDGNTITLPSRMKGGIFTLNSRVINQPPFVPGTGGSSTERANTRIRSVTSGGLDNPTTLPGGTDRPEIDPLEPTPFDPNVDIQTPVTPSGALVVVLDPGHGGSDPGKVGSLFGEPVNEREIVLEIAKKTKTEMEARGMNVLLTRSDNNDKPSTTQRGVFARNQNADYFLSIHVNSISDSCPNVRGARMYVPCLCPGAQESDGRLDECDEAVCEFVGTKHNDHKALAQSLITEFSQDLVIPTLQTMKANDFTPTYVIKDDLPSVLVETGFMCNEADLQKLVDPSYQDQIARALADSVQRLA